MLLALEGRNKTGFIDNTCRRSHTDEVLGRQWDRVNAVVIGWILNSSSEELFLGQIFSKMLLKGGIQRSQTFNNTSRPNNVPRPNNNGNRRTTGGLTLVCNIVILMGILLIGFNGCEDNEDRLPNLVLKGKSPYELVFKKKPSLNHLRIKHSYVEKPSQDLDHVNFFDEVVHEVPNTSCDDNDLSSQGQDDGSNSIYFSSPTIGQFEDELRHPQGSNGFANEDEMAATSDPNIPLFEDNIHDNLNIEHESTIPLNEINSQIPPSIVITNSPPVLPIEDPEDSLIMGNEDLNTIPEKESDEFIKSSVEDLVLIPSEYKDTSGSESVCILPLCDDFSPIDVPEEKAVTFSNPLFNSNDDFTSSDDESLSDEDVPKDNVKIYSNPLFEFDDEYISSDVNPLFDEVLENIESKDSYDSNLNELDLLVTPLSDVNKNECFDSRGDDDEINVLDYEDNYYDSKGDILYIKSLLNDDLVHHDPSIPAMSVASILEGYTDEPPLEENDDLFDLEPKNDDWKKILYDAPIDDLMTKDKVFNPEIHDQIFSPTYVSLPFTDRHYIFFTYVVRILLLYFTYLAVSPFLLSFRSEDTIFDPDISAFHFSHRSGTFISFFVYPNILNESPI
nr:ribonuclease H-like domain-containing protein [Tanacetum cinerariifolium]